MLDLNEIKQRHHPGFGPAVDHCDFDGEVWPCDAAALLSELETLHLELRADHFILAADHPARLECATCRALDRRTT